MLGFREEMALDPLADGTSRTGVNRMRPRIGCKCLQTVGHLAMELKLQSIVVRSARVGYEVREIDIGIREEYRPPIGEAVVQQHQCRMRSGFAASPKDCSIATFHCSVYGD